MKHSKPNTKSVEFYTNKNAAATYGGYVTSVLL
jgi:hypothetical protein